MRKPRQTTQTPPRVIAYLRVSTAEQGKSGLGLEAQRQALRVEAARRGWSDVEFIADDGFSAKNLTRPGIENALAKLTGGSRNTLLVAKLDRISRSLFDFTGLLERARREGWTLVALDAPVDPSSPSGEMLVNLLAAFAQFERRLVGQRTRAALQVAKGRGQRLGRPVDLPDAVRRRIVQQRQAGASLYQIADALTAGEVPTARGGLRWYASTVRGVLVSVEADRAAQAARSAFSA